MYQTIHCHPPYIRLSYPALLAVCNPHLFQSKLQNTQKETDPPCDRYQSNLNMSAVGRAHQSPCGKLVLARHEVSLFALLCPACPVCLFVGFLFVCLFVGSLFVCLFACLLLCLPVQVVCFALVCPSCPEETELCQYSGHPPLSLSTPLWPASQFECTLFDKVEWRRQHFLALSLADGGGGQMVTWEPGHFSAPRVFGVAVGLFLDCQSC